MPVFLSSYWNCLIAPGVFESAIVNLSDRETHIDREIDLGAILLAQKLKAYMAYRTPIVPFRVLVALLIR